MRLFALAALAAALGAGARAGETHATDVILTVESNTITTNGVDEAETAPQRVFASEFGEVVDNFTDEPGYDSEPGVFPTETEIGFEILDALRVWDGADFDDLTPLRIDVSFALLGPATTPATADTSVTGFTIPVQASGAWHRHLEYLIYDPTDPFAIAPTGVYLLKLRLFHTGGIEPSAPFYIVFNQNDSEPSHDAAIEYVNAFLLGPQGDLNGDGVVNSSDLAIVLGSWGAMNAPADLNDDGIVNSSDLAIVLGSWTGGGP